MIAFKSPSSAGSNHQFRITYFSTFTDKVENRLAVCQFGLAQGLAPDGIKPREKSGASPSAKRKITKLTHYQRADKNPEKPSCLLCVLGG